jgi:hypothetical protein
MVLEYEKDSDGENRLAPSVDREGVCVVRDAEDKTFLLP